MKGVVLWANPDRHPLAGATNTNGARMPVLMGDVKAKEERLTTFLCHPSLLRAYGACGALRPRLCEIQKSHRWRLSLLCHCSVLRCFITVVAEVIRLVNPPCGFFLTRACPNKSERLRRLSLRFTWIKLARVNAPAWRAAFGLSRGWFVCRLSTRLATRLSTGLAM